MIYLEVERVACPRRLVQNSENYPHHRFDAIYGTTHRSFSTGFMQKSTQSAQKKKDFPIQESLLELHPKN